MRIITRQYQWYEQTSNLSDVDNFSEGENDWNPLQSSDYGKFNRQK